jgi:hypothetical protein
MDPETRALNELYEDEDLIAEGEDDIIDEDFIRSLNAGAMPLIKMSKEERKEEEKEESEEVDPLGLMQGYIPPGMSSEMPQTLINVE